MTACATTAIFASLSSKAFDDLSSSSFVLLCGGWLASLATGIFSFMTASYARRSGFVDVPCRDTYVLPLRLIQITTSLYLFLLVGTIIYRSAVTGSRRLGQRLNETELDDIPGLVFYYGETLVMWLTLALIIFIRQRAKQIFGPSYQVRSSMSIPRKSRGLIGYTG